VETPNFILRSDNAVMRTKKEERSACFLSRPLGREQLTHPHHSPPLRYGEPQKKFAFAFFKKNWGGEKKDKNAKAKFLFLWVRFSHSKMTSLNKFVAYATHSPFFHSFSKLWH